MSEAPYSPAEPPADGDWASQAPPPGAMPRYSASASIPTPPASPQGGGGQTTHGNAASPFGQPPQFGQASSFGQDQQAGQSAGGGQARSAVGPSSPGTYGSPPQGYQSPPGGTYGQAGAASGQQYGSPAQPQFGSSPGGQNQYGSAPAGQPQFGSPPSGQPQYGSAPPSPSQFGSGATYGSSPASGPGGQAGSPGQGYGGQGFGGATSAPSSGQGSFAPPVYGQPGDPGRPQPSAGWTEGEQEPPRKSRRGLIITIIAAAILVVVGVGGYVGWSLTNNTSAFTEGVCVKQDGSDAVVTECSSAGAYKIVSIVDAENGCTDANQPSLVLTERIGGGRKFACLAPAS